MLLRRFCLLPSLASFLFLLSCSGISSHNAPSSAQPAPAATVQKTQVIYVAREQTVSTYNVDANTGAVQPAGPDITMAPGVPARGFLLQVLTTPDDHFLYVMWRDENNQEHISLFPTDARGVPQTPATQTMDVPSRTELAIHPSGQFAYLVQSVDVPCCSGSANLQAFSIDSTTGRLSEIGPAVNDPAFDFADVSLYAISRDGGSLYTEETTGFDSTSNLIFLRHSIDAKTGMLGASQSIFETDWDTIHTDVAIIGSKYIANSRDQLHEHQASFLDVTSLQDKTFSIHCVELDACLNAGDLEGALHFDPSGDFLLVTDVVNNRIRVLRVDSAAKMLRDTGNSVPYTVLFDGFLLPDLKFSPDGNLLYAVLDGSGHVNVFRFDTNSGSLTAAGFAANQTATGDFHYTPAEHR